MKRLLPVALLALASACKDREAIARADSLQAVSAEQVRLAQQLSAQKDSLTTIVVDADAFISRIDSQISRVKGLPSKRGGAAVIESPIEEQLAQRKLMLARVTALVNRAQATATELEATKKRERKLRGEVARLEDEAGKSKQLIADLGATIERQAAQIGSLQLRVDSLWTENQALGAEINELTLAQNRAFYIIGTEKELLEKKVLVRTGGANLLFARIGRSLQPARHLDRSLFTPVDQRKAVEIPIRHADKRYRIVSRQSLDDAEVNDREKGLFRGNLKIKDASQFWAPSKYLIIVEL